MRTRVSSATGTRHFDFSKVLHLVILYSKVQGLTTRRRIILFYFILFYLFYLSVHFGGARLQGGGLFYFILFIFFFIYQYISGALDYKAEDYLWLSSEELLTHLDPELAQVILNPKSNP